MNKKQIIPSVNFHLWEPCNMKCAFCFATFQDIKKSILPRGHLPKEQSLQVVKLLAEYGFQKITFAGGEPTLCKWLPDLIVTAKDAGMTTMLVTNGTRLTDQFLEVNRNKLDWIAISIDSLNPHTNLKMGRAVAGREPLQMDYYRSQVYRIKQYGFGLKINTVVNRKNFNEDMNDFIHYAKPKRWKVLQVLPIIGQNDGKIDDYTISDSEFNIFICNHSKLHKILVPETNLQIKGSYVMVDPAGRFFDDTKGFHTYSESIIKVGIERAIKKMNYNYSGFVDRGGIYDWENS